MNLPETPDSAEKRTFEGSHDRGACDVKNNSILFEDIESLNIRFIILLQMLLLRKWKKKKDCPLSRLGRKVKNLRSRTSK